MALLCSAVAPLMLLGCESGAVDQPDDAKCPTEPGSAPLVENIDDAIAAVEAYYGGPQEYFEISANLQQVSVIVAADDRSTAEQAFWVDDQLVEPASIGEAAESSQVFVAADVTFNPDKIFDRVRRELDCPVLIDFAVTGAPDGVIYDTTVASSEGGVLLVLLGANGDVHGVQAS